MSIYVIELVPAATPVTKPVEETVAAAILLEAHGVVTLADPEPVSWVVEPAQTESIPERVGGVLTVIVAVLIHPLVLV